MRPRQSARARQRGSLIVTSFVVVIAMAMIMAAVHTLLKDQIRQSGEYKGVALAKLQAYYLAEMGINHYMFEANRTGAQPGLPLTVDLTPQVALVRPPATGSAICTVSATVGGDPDAPAGAPPFKVTAVLTTPGGTYRKTVFFNSAMSTNPPQRVLTAYRVGR